MNLTKTKQNIIILLVSLLFNTYALAEYSLLKDAGLNSVNRLEEILNNDRATYLLENAGRNTLKELIGDTKDLIEEQKESTMYELQRRGDLLIQKASYEAKKTCAFALCMGMVSACIGKIDSKRIEDLTHEAREKRKLKKEKKIKENESNIDYEIN